LLLLRLSRQSMVILSMPLSVDGSPSRFQPHGILKLHL
jgi:hypothetical protein